MDAYTYQEIVNSLGVPSEMAVNLRIAATGAELVRAGEHLSNRASELGLKPLDSSETPNTAPDSLENGWRY